MTALAYRRSVMTLYADAADPLGHCVRLVLTEKDINVEVHFIDEESKPEDLHDLNPYHTLLTLIDRDLVLYDDQIMLEYLDERFPHPPLMPVDPVSRAQSRLLLYRIERDWYGLTARIDQEQDRREKAALRKQLRDTLLQCADLFRLKPFFLSDEFSLVDATIAPILWRLPHYEIDLPAAQAQPILRYAGTVFSRDAFRVSLSPAEQGMRLA